MKKTIGEKIREARKAAGFTQNQLAKKTVIAQATLSHYERGNITPSIPTLETISRAVGCNLVVELQKRKTKNGSIKS